MVKSSIAGDASKKILRILFSLVFAAGLLPYVPVASAYADQSQGAQSQPDVLAEDNPEAVSSEKDASVDGSAASLDPSKQIEFVYVDQKDISVGDTQNVVVSFADSKNADGSTLYYQKQGGKIESIKASKSADGAALYEIPFKTASDCGKYNLVKVAWNGSSSGESKIASDTEDGYSFSVVDKVVDEDKDGVSAYSLDGNGEITKEDSVADAIVSATNETANSSPDNDAAVSEGAAGEVQSYASVAGVAPLAIGSDGSRASKKMVIALDAGHGGSDSGAVNESKGLYEKTLTLKIAQYCKAELDTYSNVSTYMTRSGDEYVGLSERVKRAVNAGANVFVSFHINSAESVATGFEVWVQNDSSWRYYLHEQSSQLGNNILSKLTALGLANRGNKESDSKSGNKYADGSPADYLTVLEQSRQNNIPAVLIEHGFINGKPADQNLLSSESGLKSMGVADAKAIAENYGLSKGGQSVSSSSSIMGQSSTAVGQMVAYYESTGHSYPSSVYANKGAASLRDFCQIAYEEAAAEGVRAEVLFCQAMKETGWLQFGGDVKADQCNFGGLGATGGGAQGATFANVREGLRAQVQHLKAYASTDALVNDCADPRFNLVSRGCAPNLEDLNGRWAVPGDGYGQDILRMINSLLGESSSGDNGTGGTGQASYSIDYKYSAPSAALDKTIEDGEYLIQCQSVNGSVLQINDDGSAYSSALSLATSNMKDSQKFKFERDSSTGYYRIKSSDSGKYLGLISSGGKYSACIAQRSYSSDDVSLQWKVESNSDGSVVIKAAVNEGYCFGSASDGSKVQLHSANGTAAQRFSLISTSPKVEGGRTVDDGVYTVSLSSDRSIALGISGSSVGDGGNAQATAAAGLASQKFRFTLKDDGFYEVLNLNSGKVLDADGGNLVLGTNVLQWSDCSTDNQRWAVQRCEGGYRLVCKANGLALALGAGAHAGSNAFVSVPADGQGQVFSIEPAVLERVVSDGEYVVSSQVEATQVFDIAGASTENGARLEVYRSNMAQNQRFRFERDGDTGFYKVTCVGSGKVLDDDNRSVSNGAAVIQYDSTDALNQRWIVQREGSGLSIRSAIDPSYCIDLTGGGASDCTKAEVYRYGGGENQRFSLISTKIAPVSESEDYGFEGWYGISPASDDSLRIDIAKASSVDGAKALLYGSNSGFNQLFNLEYENGYYRLISACSGKALELEAGSVVPGIAAQQASISDSPNQKWKVERNEDGTYSFICIANGLKLGFSSLDAGASLVGKSLDSTDGISFRLAKRTSFLNEGIFSISYGKDRGKVLDVNNASKSDGANVLIYSSASNLNQKWKVSAVPGRENVYTFESLCSGKYMTVANGNVVQATYEEGSEKQMWTPVNIDAGAVVLQNVSAGKVLDVNGGSTSNGANVQVYSRNGSAAQRFFLDSVEPVKNATFVLHSGANYNQVIDLNNSSPNDGAKVTTWGSNNGDNQKWNVTGNGDGTYRIGNPKTGKVLDISGGAASDGACIVQHSWHGGLNQKWIVVYDKDGGFVFESAQDRSIVLAVGSSAPSDGASIRAEKKSGKASQRFCLEETVYVPPMPSDRQAMQNRIWGYGSGTQWLIGVDRSSHQVGVFRGSAYDWSLQHWWSCVTGAPSTPT